MPMSVFSYKRSIGIMIRVLLILLIGGSVIQCDRSKSHALSDSRAKPPKDGSLTGYNLGDPYYITNGEMAVTIDAELGHITSVHDLVADLELLRPGAQRANFYPFAFSILRKGLFGKYMKVDYGPVSHLSLTGPPQVSIEQSQYPEGQRRKISWITTDGYSIDAIIEMASTGRWVEFSAKIDAGNNMIYSLAYPFLFGLDHLSGDGTSDRLALPFESGMEIIDPVHNILELATELDTWFSAIRYPDGHQMMIQMMSYYSPDKDDGFVFYARDPNFTEKSFGFFPLDSAQENGLPTFWIEHLNWDVNGGGGAVKGILELDYPLRIESLGCGKWYCGGDIYKNFSSGQIWSSAPIKDRSAQRRRIFEKTAVSIFGLSGRYDQSEWMRVFHDYFTGAVPEDSVLFVPGWDFHVGADAFGGAQYALYQAGWREDYWLPFAGSFMDMLELAHSQGDLVYPFYYDLEIRDNYPGWTGWQGTPDSSGDLGAPWESHVTVKYSGDIDVFAFHIPGFQGWEHETCPADPVTQDFYHWRTIKLASGGGEGPPYLLDGLYHDITITVGGRSCFDRLGGYYHGHPQIGWSRFMISAHRQNMAAFLGADQGLSFGVENATEPFFDIVDFYHLGAPGDGPYRSKKLSSELDSPEFIGPDQLIMSGKARQIPLVEYVSHANGPLRTGGKLQISYEIGDAWYWVAAYDYINGGITELIYFNTPVDLLPEINPEKVPCPGGYPCAFMTNWFQLDGLRDWFYGSSLMKADPRKKAFLADCADLRLRLGNPYLTSGVMLPPPAIDPPPEPADLSYYFYSSIQGPLGYHQGTYSAEPLLASAFADPENPSDVALFAANILEQESSFDLVFNADRYGIPHDVSAVLYVAGSAGSQSLGQFHADANGDIRIPLTLSGRSLVKVKLNP